MNGLRRFQKRNAFTVPELLVAVAVGLVLLAVVASASIAIQRSIAATDHFVSSSNNGGRLLDYVTRDLRRALGVGTLVGGVVTPLKNNVSISVSETSTLTINLPDYYGANAVNPDPSSLFRTSRYTRAKLNTLPAYNGNGAAQLNGCIYWKEAVKTVGTTQTTRFAPTSAGTGQIQVRYYRAARSAKDSTVCYFRAEYPLGSNTPNFPPQEVAERVTINGSPTSLVVAATNLPLKDPNYGRSFTVRSTFTPRYQRSLTSSSIVEQAVTVVLRNPRRD